MTQYFITWVIKYSRYPKGEHIDLDLSLNLRDRKLIYKILKKIILIKKYKVEVFNILDDHVHLVLECFPKDRRKIIKNLKGVSSHEYNSIRGRTIKSRGRQCALWAKKYHLKVIENRSELNNICTYVRFNHEKHGLPSIY